MIEKMSRNGGGTTLDDCQTVFHPLSLTQPLLGRRRRCGILLRNPHFARNKPASIRPMAKKPIKPKAPEVCPVCGENVPTGALACPECGADHNSGWREDANIVDALDMPEEDFDYDEFIRKEFGSDSKPAGVSTVWWIVSIVLLLVLLGLYFYSAH